MPKRYICEASNGSSRSGVTHKFRETCTDCMSIPPCICTDVRIPCEACNRTFRSQACFDKHKTNKLKGKTVCAQKRNCAKCDGLLVPMRNHECFKSFCENCQKNREYGHLCYMAPLENKLPKSDNVLLVFYDFETRQDTKISDSATLHVPNLEMLATVPLTMRDAGRYRHGVRALWSAKTLVVGRPRGRTAILSV